MTIYVGIGKTNKLNVQRSKNRDLGMAIEDMFRCKNIPDFIVESTWFRQKIDLDQLRGMVSNF